VRRDRRVHGCGEGINRSVRAALVIALASAVAARAVCAQSASDLLAIPVGIGLCQSVTSTIADSAHLIFRFVPDDTVYSGSFLVTYDSIGTPLDVVVQRSGPRGATPGLITSVAGASFRGNGRSGYALVESDSVGRVVPSHSSDSNRRPLTASELSSARGLALWLWGRRCRGRPSH
jgi:hypothetical protein